MSDDLSELIEKEETTLTNSDTTENSNAAQFPNKPTQTRFFYRSSFKRSFDSSDPSDDDFTSDTDTSSFTKNDSSQSTDFTIQKISYIQQKQTVEIPNEKQNKEEEQSSDSISEEEPEIIIPQSLKIDHSIIKNEIDDNSLIKLKNYYKNNDSQKNIKWPTEYEIKDKLQALHNLKLNEPQPYLSRVTEMVEKDRYFEARYPKAVERSKSKISVPLNQVNADKHIVKKEVKKNQKKREKIIASETSYDSDIVFIDQKPIEKPHKSIPTEYSELL